MNQWIREYAAPGGYLEVVPPVQRDSPASLPQVEAIPVFDLCSGLCVQLTAAGMPGRGLPQLAVRGNGGFLLQLAVIEAAGDVSGSMLFRRRPAAGCTIPKNTVLIAMSGEWVAAYFGTQERVALLNSRLQSLPGGCYGQPLPYRQGILLRDVLRQPAVHARHNLTIMNGLLLLVEQFMERLDVLLNDQNGMPVLQEDDMRRLRLVEGGLRARIFGPAPTIKQLSRTAAMSTTKLKMLFKCVYGAPVYQYYQKLRMDEARKLLLDGQQTVKEAGIKVGYTNLSHFAGAFKREFGLLPSELCPGRSPAESRHCQLP